MRQVPLVLATAALFGFGPLLYRVSPLLSSIGAVALAILFATAVARAFTAVAIGTGALGALGAALLGGITAPLGGAVLLAGAYVDRLLRVRGTRARAAHLGLSLAAGAGAAQIVHSYAGAPLALRLVALSMAVVVALVPLLVPADDRLAHALDALSMDLPPDLTRLLREAAELRRHVRDVTLPAPAEDNAVLSWRALLELATARARLETARKVGAARLGSIRALTRSGHDSGPTAEDNVAHLVERRIEEHVAALARTYSSFDTVSAGSLGLDPAALAAVAGSAATSDGRPGDLPSPR